EPVGPVRHSRPWRAEAPLDGIETGLVAEVELDTMAAGQPRVHLDLPLPGVDHQWALEGGESLRDLAVVKPDPVLTQPAGQGHGRRRRHATPRARINLESHGVPQPGSEYLPRRPSGNLQFHARPLRGPGLDGIPRHAPSTRGCNT